VLKGNASFPVFSKTHTCGFGAICGWLVVDRLLKWERCVLSCVSRIFGLVVLRLMALLLWLFRLPEQVICRENLKLNVCFGVCFTGFDDVQYSE